MTAIFKILDGTTIALTIVLGLISVAGALHLTLKVRRLPAMASFLPIAVIPAIFGLLLSSLSFMREVGTSLETGNDDVSLLLMLSLCLVPTVLGVLASVPGYLVIGIGLFLHTLRMPQAVASVATAKSKTPRPAKPRRTQTIDHEQGKVRVDEMSYLTMDAPQDIDY